MEASLKRRQDWPVKLAVFIDSSLDRPFSWSNANCGAFVANAINAMTDTDVLKNINAKRSYKSTGLLPIVAQLAANYGCVEIQPTLAQRGDVVMFNGLHGETLGICVGSLIAGPGPAGLAMIKMDQASRAWRI